MFEKLAKKYFDPSGLNSFEDLVSVVKLAELKAEQKFDTSGSYSIEVCKWWKVKKDLRSAVITKRVKLVFGDAVLHAESESATYSGRLAFEDEQLETYYLQKLWQVLMQSRRDRTAFKVFALRVVFGSDLSLKDIAVMLNISYEAVRWNLKKIKGKFEKLVSEVYLEDLESAKKRLYRVCKQG